MDTHSVNKTQYSPTCAIDDLPNLLVGLVYCLAHSMLHGADALINFIGHSAGFILHSTNGRVNSILHSTDGRVNSMLHSINGLTNSMYEIAKTKRRTFVDGCGCRGKVTDNSGRLIASVSVSDGLEGALRYSRADDIALSRRVGRSSGDVYMASSIQGL